MHVHYNKCLQEIPPEETLWTEGFGKKEVLVEDIKGKSHCALHWEYWFYKYWFHTLTWGTKANCAMGIKECYPKVANWRCVCGGWLVNWARISVGMQFQNISAHYGQGNRAWFLGREKIEMWERDSFRSKSFKLTLFPSLILLPDPLNTLSILFFFISENSTSEKVFLATVELFSHLQSSQRCEVWVIYCSWWTNCLHI